MTFEEEAMKRMKEILADEEAAKLTGFHYNDYCWTCRNYFEKLRWMMCGNGSLTYHCEDCYTEIMLRSKK